jgi:hypothetical protein
MYSHERYPDFSSSICRLTGRSTPSLSLTLNVELGTCEPLRDETG